MTSVTVQEPKILVTIEPVQVQVLEETKSIAVSIPGVQGVPGPEHAFITFVIGDESTAIPSGLEGFTAPIPFDANILSWSIADISSSPVNRSFEVDIYRDNYLVQYPPATKMSGNKPIKLNNEIIAKQEKNQFEDQWSLEIFKDDTVGFKVKTSDGTSPKLMIVLYLVRPSA